MNIKICKALGLGIMGMSILSVMPLTAKDNKGIIMTVDGEEVPSEEFLYLFKKNNRLGETKISPNCYIISRPN